jgi:nucleotide-binding universal stress UspA family protein
MRLLVGYDGSDGGRDALELARELLGTTGEGSAMVVAVIPYGPLPVRFAELEADAAAAAEPLLSEARERLQGIEVQTRAFGGGSPAWVLTDLAERHRVDLIVVGSPHRGAIGRTLIGSVAEGVLHGAPCAVAVAPRGAQAGHRPFSLIGVAYDGTPEAKAALQRARVLAEEWGAAVRVLTVVAPPVALPGVAGYTPVEPPEPDDLLDEGVGALGTRIAVEGRKLHGPPAPTLASACKDGIDLLVAGSRSYGPMLRVLLGSVSSRLIAEAPCPVLVVPRPRDGGA